MALLGFDEFADTDGVTVQAHTPDNGGGWTRHGSATSDFQISANRMRSVGTLSLCHKADAPATDGQMVAAIRVRLVGSTATRIAACSRVKTGAPSFYMGGIDSSGLFLTRVVTGAATTLASTAYTLVVDEDYILECGVTDALKWVAITRVSTSVRTELTSADNTLAAASGDRAGVYADQSTTSTTGTHGDSFEVSDPSAVTATAIATGRVFQRGYGGGSGDVTAVGTYTGTPTKVQVRIMRSSTEVVGWTDAVLTAGAYAATISTPEGGGLTQQVRAFSGRNAVLGAIAAPANTFGVGILTCFIANSNGVGLGTGTNTTANTSLFRFADSAWAQVSTLSGKISTDSTNATAIPALLNAIQVSQVALGNSNAVVGYIKTCRGLTPMRTVAGTVGANTYANGDCWSYRTTRTDAATVYGLAITALDAAIGKAPEFCIINSGDDDAGFSPTVAQWKTAFNAFKTNWDADLTNGSSTKFIMNITGRNTGAGGGDAFFNNIRQAQMELVDGSRVFDGTCLIDLGMIDAAHLNAAGYDIMGARDGRAINGVLAASANVGDPRMLSAVFTDATRTVVRCAITHKGGTDFTPTTAILGFTVTDSIGVKTISSAVRQSATTIDITLSAACTGATTMQYLSGQNPSGPTGLLQDNQATPTALIRPTAGALTVSSVGGGRRGTGFGGCITGAIAGAVTGVAR